VSDATTAILLLSCADQPGLVRTVADFIFRHGGNILHADQHIDHEEGAFFQRVEFTLDGFGVAREEVRDALAADTGQLGMHIDVRFSDVIPRVAILVSREAHCMEDLLTRWRTGDLAIDLPLVVSNHPEHEELVTFMGPRYVHLPIDPDDKQAQEAELDRLLTSEDIGLVVLARYMQILSPSFVNSRRGQIINIHHSFLPAFAGARPYHQAHQRGVKLIGATAHYASEELDAGPIIEQDVVRVSHRDSVDDLVRKGRDLERVVLSRAVRAHVEGRILLHGNKTVVFA
jgi:formyltetrahydrofolate deformylase